MSISYLIDKTKLKYAQKMINRTPLAFPQKLLNNLKTEFSLTKPDTNKIIWSEKYSVGEDSLDNQHKKIIDLINQLHEHISLDVSSEIMIDIINDINKYIYHHLDYEEALLKSLGYPDLEHHKELHVSYLEEVMQFTIDAANYDNSVPEKLLNFLEYWWNHHPYPY